jgi:soluble lytic murein transglycosylase-like protein
MDAMARAVVLALVATAIGAAPARADLVYFASGRTLSVKAHWFEADKLVMSLRGGGEIICEPSAVARIAPDEVPYPAPASTTPDEQPAVQRDVPDSRVGAATGVFNPIIERASAEHGVDPRLVRAVIQVESAYRPRARSRKGAMGLMQLMPETARLYAVTDPYDPAANIDAGTRHLRTLLDRFDLANALAAYNAGAAAVERFRGIPPFPETRNYVARILKLVRR